jgi:hypothetical protein
MNKPPLLGGSKTMAEIKESATGMVSTLHTFDRCNVCEEEKQKVRINLKQKLFLLICDKITDDRLYSLSFETVETPEQGMSVASITMIAYIVLTFYNQAKVGEYVSPGIGTIASDALSREESPPPYGWQYRTAFGFALQRIA